MKCTAKSSMTGQPCQRWAIKGGNVCPTHGGRAPQVKAAAMDRIRAGADQAAAELVRLACNADSESVRVQAIKDLLDRAGYGAKQKLEQDVTIHGDSDDVDAEIRRLYRELAAGGESPGARRSDVVGDSPA